MKVFDTITTDWQNFIRRQKMFFVATAPMRIDGHVNVSPKGYDCFRIIDATTVCYLDMTGSGNETAAHIKENGRLTFMWCSMDHDCAPVILRLYGRGEVLLRPPDHPIKKDDDNNKERDNDDTHHDNDDDNNNDDNKNDDNAKDDTNNQCATTAASVVRRNSDSCCTTKWHELIQTHYPDGILPSSRQIIINHVERVQTSCGYAVPMFDYRADRETLKKFFTVKEKQPGAMETYWQEHNMTSIDGIVTPYGEAATATAVTEQKSSSTTSSSSPVVVLVEVLVAVVAVVVMMAVVSDQDGSTKL